MRKMLLAGAVALSAMATPAMAAEVALPGSSITFQPGGNTVTGNQAIFLDFDGTADASVATGVFTGGSDGGAREFSTSEAGVAARPGGEPSTISSGDFGGVTTGGSFLLTFATPVQVLSFTLGSLDAYNQIRFTFANGNTTTLNGAQINEGSQADGNQVDPDTNGRVTYDLGAGDDFGLGFQSAEFFSIGANSFEFDNFASAVPEPAAWGMMLLGFGLAGSALRTRRRSAGLATA